MNAFWDISDDFRNAISTLTSQDLDKMSGNDLRGFLAGHSVGDLFGKLNPEDLARIADEGKIPVHASWADRVHAGTASWDGMLTEAAIGAFATDQKALDARVRSLL